MNLEPFATHAFAFLIGAAIGAAGHYFGEEYTDRRRDHEAATGEERLFKKISNQAPDLIAAMCSDLAQETSGLLRDFLFCQTHE